MNWSLEYYNLICYTFPSSEIFKNYSGNSSFLAERLFEGTSDEVMKRFEGNIATLSELPALVVAEVADPRGEPSTPAFFTQIREVRKKGSEVSFFYKHLTTKLTSEDVFGSPLFDIENWERRRTHWAVKQGDLVSQLFELLNGRDDPNLPRLFDIEAWPPPRLNHIAVMMPFSAEFNSVYEVIKDVCKKAGCPALRVDEIYGPEKIINDVFSTISKSRLVICDLPEIKGHVLFILR